MKPKKFILLFMPVVVLVVLVYPLWGWSAEETTVTSRNLILNPNFETLDDSGKLNFWKEDAKGGWSVDAREPYSEERSMRATVAWSWLSQEIPVRAKAYYTLKAYVRSDITIPEKKDYHNTFLTLECLNWRKKVINKEWGIVNATSSWQLKKNLIFTPPGTRKIRIMLGKREGEGNVWFDEVELKEVPPGAVLNPGFEMISEKKPKFWKEHLQGGWSLDAREPYSEERSMQATVAWSWLSQEVPVKSERYYILRAYVRSDITIPEKADYHNTFLTLECLNKKNKVIQREWGIVNATSSWQLRENTIFVPPGTRKIGVKLAKREGEGSVWFDNVSLVEMPPSLVLNATFEMLDRSGRPLFWRVDRRGGWSVRAQGAHQGMRSMQATVAWSWLSQEIPVRPKTYYSLKAYVRSDIAIPEKADYYNTFLTLECLDKENKLIKREWGIANATFLWQLKENSIFTPAETKKIRIKLAKRQGGGSVWFDDVEMIRHRYPPHLWGDKPFYVFYFSLYAILVLSLLRIIFKKKAAPVRKNK